MVSRLSEYCTWDTRYHIHVLLDEVVLAAWVATSILSNIPLTVLTASMLGHLSEYKD